MINKCYSLAASGTNFDTLFAKYNQRTGYENTPGYHGLVDIDFNELAKQSNGLKKNLKMIRNENYLKDT